MNNRRLAISVIVLALTALNIQAKPSRQDIFLCDNWKFTRQDGQFSGTDVVDSDWESVSVPHDWAIYGPFDENNDAQYVAIVQNFETEANLKTGRTGGLPSVGTGWYRTVFDIPDYSKGKAVEIIFDGAMSNAEVYVNGALAGQWPYGYNSFHLDISQFVNGDGKANTLAVRLENLPESSRWYSGAGLFRNVHLCVTAKTHIPVWGTQISCPEISETEAAVDLKVRVEGGSGKIRTIILDPQGRKVAVCRKTLRTDDGYSQRIRVRQPELWSPESPALYRAVTSIHCGLKKVDEYSTTFGIRKIELIPDKGFFLNGKPRKIHGVCNHHDLGPLGAAVNEAALRHQLVLLKEMGCDAIRTAHNMPAPELVRLCDEMGFMMMIEPFDEWNTSKCRNGYNRLFSEWAEKDMVNMVHQYRNSPSVIFWSIGNEVPDQCEASGPATTSYLAGICRREDPTRFVTCGMDQVKSVVDNGMADLLDVPGFNYRVHLYRPAYEKLDRKLVLGSETASTVSTRGVYKFPAEKKAMAMYGDRHCSSYDLEYCDWSNLPEDDFVMEDDNDWDIGQFVWTGFDYLGEPTPYETMPNHSSNFGIIDLASIPKDRYYLYRSIWKPEEETLHILPHWTWPGREGKVTPVFVYTNYSSAELFVNGVSKGRRMKETCGDKQSRYRLMWDDVVYEPGEVKVVAYDDAGDAVAESIVRTAGEPYRLNVKADRVALSADGKDLAYIEVSAVDRNGNLCPSDNSLVSFSTDGNAASFRAAANGDPTCLDLFHLPQMHLFNGKLTAIVQAGNADGDVVFKASADKMIDGEISIAVR